MPAEASFERQADGTWKTGVTVLKVDGSRLTGDNVDLTLTRLPDGFRISGIFFKDDVDIVVDARGARARSSPPSW